MGIAPPAFLTAKQRDFTYVEIRFTGPVFDFLNANNEGVNVRAMGKFIHYVFFPQHTTFAPNSLQDHKLRSLIVFCLTQTNVHFQMGMRAVEFLFSSGAQLHLRIMGLPKPLQSRQSFFGEKH